VTYVAVVLAGGTARRLGGIDKTALPMGDGAPALERVLASLAGAAQVVVVGPERAVEGAVRPRWTRESPPGGGPLAGLAAGLAALGPVGAVDAVVVLAGDLPLVTSAVVDALVAGCRGEQDAAALVDADGVRQPLAAAYRPAFLQSRLTELGDPTGLPARRLLDRAAVTDVPDLWRAGEDFDTWPDRDRIEELLRDD
jgi:molybdopterin-guanine dinucleotide biosynthesis protein A